MHYEMTDKTEMKYKIRLTWWEGI